MQPAKTHFEPWVGRDFGTGALGSKRLLVLGEAHYSDQPDEDRGSLTQELIRDVRAGSRHIPYFTKLQELLTELEPTTQDPYSVRDAVGFYNYVQGFAADAARVRPTEEMWTSGQAPFAKVLNELRPTRVLVTGADLWNALSTYPMPGWSSAKESVDNQEHIFVWSSGAELRVRATWINHPSSYGFQASKWSDRVRALIR
jgi:hypothetical protein